MGKLTEKELLVKLKGWRNLIVKSKISYNWDKLEEEAYEQIKERFRKKGDCCGNCDFFSQKVFGADNPGKCFRFYKELKTILWVQYDYWCKCRVA